MDSSLVSDGQVSSPELRGARNYKSCPRQDRARRNRLGLIGLKDVDHSTPNQHTIKSMSTDFVQISCTSWSLCHLTSAQISGGYSRPGASVCTKLAISSTLSST